MSLETNKTHIDVDIKGGDDDNTNTKDEEQTKLQEQQTKLRGCTIEGNWDKVEELYKSDANVSTMNINKNVGTALHMAVNEGNESVVRSLVASILHHNKAVAFGMKNGKGDTPLHLAALRGFKEICECIIGENDERKDLIDIDNNNEETALFLASLSWQKESFLYLFSLATYSKSLFRINGDSILHIAILGEFFDLALIIIHTFPDLGGITNNEGYTPLKLLATRPSAFESGCKMTWWKKILYHCISVENLNIEEAIKYYGMKQDQENLHPSCPRNYETCGFFLRKCQEYAYQLLCIVRHLLGFTKLPIDAHIRHASNNKVKEQTLLSDQQQISISISSDCELLPKNYATYLWFLKFAYIYILGLSGVGVHEVRKMKQKHKWCSQLLTSLMKTTYDSYYGANKKPPRNVSGTDSKTTDDPNKVESIKLLTEDTIKDLCETTKSEDTKKCETLKSEDAKKLETLKIEEEKKAETLKSETPILTAARYGIVEMVNVIIKKIPSSIYDTNLENKNILLVAVENRRTVVVESIRKWYEECDKKEVFDSLIQHVDNEDNTMLHLAATPSGQDWNIHGAALQLTWHIKWFQYVKGLVPKHFTIKTNKKNQTAGETFKDKNNCLVQKGSEWLKTTSESCSVVAGLLAGVSFATSSTIPGGNKGDTGEPALEGKPPFDTFALSSLIGLCFSVTALIMFLSILVSRKEAIDFKIDLPRKLLWGLSSLFLSIIAMFIAFCSGNFFLIDKKYKQIVLPIYIFTCFPVTLYAILYIELLRGILTKIPMRIDKGEDL